MISPARHFGSELAQLSSQLTGRRMTSLFLNAGGFANGISISNRHRRLSPSQMLGDINNRVVPVRQPSRIVLRRSNIIYIILDEPIIVQGLPDQFRRCRVEAPVRMTVEASRVNTRWTDFRTKQRSSKRLFSFSFLVKVPNDFIS
jgi:hypothetical protein